MQQPSEEVMQWATTAGAATPPASMMRNVAHGGARRKTQKTHKKTKSHKKNKKAHKSHKKNKKSHKKNKKSYK
jgi:hypothetical protein